MVDSLEEPGRNLTGTTNIGPIEQQINQILLPLVPEAEKIGLIYNSSEINAQLPSRYRGTNLRRARH